MLSNTSELDLRFIRAFLACEPKASTETTCRSTALSLRRFAQPRCASRWNMGGSTFLSTMRIVDRGDGLPGHATLDSVRRTFETNVFGTLAVTQAMLPLLRKSTAARIVNVSSGLGSLTFNSDPDWEFSQVKFFGYSGSKATLDMMTVQLAAELAGDGIEVNAADPVFTANDLNQYRGYQTVEQGAEIVTRLALLGDNGPTGGFYCAGGANPW